MGTLLIADSYPDGTECSISLPQQYCISTFVCWTDPSWDLRLREWISSMYNKASTVGCGQYVADFDITNRVTKVRAVHPLRIFCFFS